MICVHVRPEMTQIALLEGRTLVEHYISRASDDATQIDGNIYRGRVQNVLPGMEAAFVDIGTPKNAVLYHGDVRYDTDDVESGSPSGQPRIEQLLRPGQTILCQVTKNPIGAKGARLTQEVSLPGRFVVLVPNSTAYGISKRLEDGERKRLRRIVDAVRPPGHGLIVRTAAAGATAEELGNDVERLVAQWETIAAEATRGQGPALLYREPAIAVRVIREELNVSTARWSSTTWRSTSRSGTMWVRSIPSSPTGWSTSTPTSRRCRCSSGTTSTSSCTKPSTARSSSPPAVRWSSTAPRP